MTMLDATLKQSLVYLLVIIDGAAVALRYFEFWLPWFIITWQFIYFSLSRDPLCIVNDNAGCNGENGHAEEEDTEDPIAINDDSNNPDTDPNAATGSSNNSASAEVTANNRKKPRKSSAEKFLEDNTEYYGFQVLPSKLRSSVENSTTTFETNTTTPPTSTFLDCLHQLPLAKSSLHQLPLTKSQTKSNSGSSDTEAELTDEMGAAKAVSKTIKQNLL